MHPLESHLALLWNGSKAQKSKKVLISLLIPEKLRMRRSAKIPAPAGFLLSLEGPDHTFPLGLRGFVCKVLKLFRLSLRCPDSSAPVNQLQILMPCLKVYNLFCFLLVHALTNLSTKCKGLAEVTCSVNTKNRRFAGEES